MISQLIKYVTIVCAAATLTGCASMMSGSYQNVPISSMPNGADLTVDGYSCGTTPMLVRLKRDRPHVVTLAKEGFQEQNIQLSRAFNPWTVGNAVLPGTFIGVGIDASTGAMFKIVPEQVNVPLKPAS